MTDEKLVWICIAFVMLYTVLWWFTSLEPVSRREKLKRGLRPLYTETANILSNIRKIDDDDDFRDALKTVDTHQQGVVDWLAANMGEAAVRKFLTVNRTSHSYIWKGQHDQQLTNMRDNYLDALHGRIENLNSLLESDSWDGPQPSFWEKVKKATNHAKTRNPFRRASSGHDRP